MEQEIQKKKPLRNLLNRINRRELKELMRNSTKKRVTLSYYKYHKIEDPYAFRDELFINYHELGVLGRIYVAQEGVNAQLSVPEERYEDFRKYMDTWPMFRGMRLNIAVEADGKSFFTLTIKVRNKIVADGIDDPEFDPSKTGVHLNAEAWNKLAEDPNTVIVDMRNHYESEVGRFENAIVPDAVTFREELPVVAEMLEQNKDKNILMYCTGGIRCEKASAYMKYRGFNNVFQLEGGIIEYNRQVRAGGLKNKFLGVNFVFDERLGERISEDIIAQCHQCGSPADTHVNCANSYCHILFIQCPACAENYSQCCSEQCASFNALSEEEQKMKAPYSVFNGSKFGKGAYKAFRKSGTQLNKD